MKKIGTGQPYLVSRAVEEPLEATFSLGEDISRNSDRLRWPVLLGSVGIFLFIILLISNLYYLVQIIYDLFIGGLETSTSLLLQIAIMSLVLIILISLIFTTLIYLIQIYKFNTHLSQRYTLVTELKNAKFSDNATKQKGRTGSRSKGKVKDQVDKNSGSAKYLKNPIFAMLDLVEEAMHTLPQIVKLLRFCTYFISIILVLLVHWVFTLYIFEKPLVFTLNYWDFVLSGVIIIIFLPTIKLLMDSETLFTYLQTRHNIIDSVRFEKDLRVPPGKDQIDRLINYLTETDPYIKSSNLAEVGAFKKDAKLTGGSGKEYKFDAYFSSINILKSRSLSLGMPMGDFGVFIKVFKSDITLKKVQGFRNVILDICDKKDMFPLRIIALQWKIGELSNQTYNYVLENPIQLKNTLTHLEVAAEDGDVYSFIPIISYGKEL